MCGVFGVRAPARDVARLTYFGLHALQHRGQESAGIAVSEDGRLTALRDLGLVAQVFDERSLSGLHGELAIGHTRYSTTGGNGWENAQPLLHHGRVRTVALGHNGNLVNAEALRQRVGKRLGSSSDSEVIAALIADDERPLEQAVPAAMAKLTGAATVVGLADGRLFAFRDAHGFRPLVLGRLGSDPVIASETCALALVGAEFEREVRPGELVIADEDGLQTIQALEPAERGALCIFEFFYLARPGHAPLGRRGARRPRADGRAARSGSAGRGRPRAADPRLGHPRRDRLRARHRHPVQRRADQEPLRRPHVHPARAGHARAGHPDEVQPARRGERQAPRRRRRLDRPRLDDAPDRRDAVRRRARPRCTCASPRRRSSRRASTGSTSPPRTR